MTTDPTTAAELFSPDNRRIQDEATRPDERPLLLDLFCCAGGAARGYVNAGFRVIGADNVRQKNYPYEFWQMDWRDALDKALALGVVAVHNSPPCQPYSITKHSHSNEHPELLEPVREAMQACGLPYVIENVVGAPLLDPLTLCGTEFGLEAFDPATDEVVYMRRHRLFESNVPLWGAGGCRCLEMRRAGRQCAGSYGGGSVDRGHAKNVRRGGYTPAKAVRAALLGIDWNMSLHQLAQAIPPAYTEHVGSQLLAHLRAQEVAA